MNGQTTFEAFEKPRIVIDAGPFAGSSMDELSGKKRRSMRARTQDMVVIPQVDADGECIGMYDVHSLESEKVHTVVLDLSQCSCEDMKYNHPKGGCKHIKRVAIGINETDLPAPSQQAGEYPTSIGDAHDQLATESGEIPARIEEMGTAKDPLGA
jgi:hypothetical protein